MALPDMKFWDLNAALRDVQLMAMASWMSHEEKKVVEVQQIMAKELNETLLIKTEDPSVLIYAHQHLASNPQVLPDYVERKAQDIALFKDIERLFGDDLLHACMRRWNTLSYSLKIREYHSPTRMREALARVPLYK